MIYDQETRDAAGRAADWLEANPMHHISVSLALSAAGRFTSFHDPDAVCFCALGRLGRELPVDNLLSDYSLLFKVLGEKEARSVYLANDKDTRKKTILTGVERGSPDGIAALRKIQNGEEL